MFFDTHIEHISTSAFYHLLNITIVRHFLLQHYAEMKVENWVPYYPALKLHCWRAPTKDLSLFLHFPYPYLFHIERILLPKPILFYLGMVIHAPTTIWFIKFKWRSSSGWELHMKMHMPMDFSCITSIILKHTLTHYISIYNEQKCSADVDNFSICGIYCIFVHPRQSTPSSVAFSEVSSF